MSEQLDAG